jgi:hypothetical protein
MNCSAYRENYAAFAVLPLPREIWDTPEWSAWMEHSHKCRDCSDWALAQRIVARGHDPASFPCVHVGNQLTQTCEQHQNRHDCPDILIIYFPRFDEYSIPIRDGGSSSTTIHFCPWCGVKLPDSKRHRWFQELEALGYNDPFQEDIPSEYRTDAWYKKAK